MVVVAVHGCRYITLLPLPLWERVGERGRVLAKKFLSRALALSPSGSPYDSGGRVEESPQGGRRDAASFSTGHGCPVEKPRNPHAYLEGRRPGRRVIRGAVSFGIATISVVTFLYSGHPALRPSGRLRRSNALLRVRGQAKKSDPASGRRTEARRRRARSRQRENQMQSHWIPAFAGMTT